VSVRTSKAFLHQLKNMVSYLANVCVSGKELQAETNYLLPLLLEAQSCCYYSVTSVVITYT